MGYLDSTGLKYLWSKIKAYVDAHAGAKGDKGDKGEKGDSPIVSYSRSGLVVHAYGNANTKCSTTNGTYTNLPAFTTVQNGGLSSLYAKSSNNQIKINKSGLYVFQVRLIVNSGTANKRVELAPFVNGSRQAGHSSTYNTGGDFNKFFMTTLLMDLSAGNTVDFRIAPIERVAVTVTMADINVFALDWDGKVSVS